MNDLVEYYQNIDSLLEGDGFSLQSVDKRKIYEHILGLLTKFHCNHNMLYSKFINAIPRNSLSSDFMYLPTIAFKEYSLKSSITDDSWCEKELRSSGTSGTAQSKIYIDGNASKYQMKVLAKIVGKFVGARRREMLVIDSPPKVSEKSIFSARVAASRGFSVFSSKTTYALNDDLSLNVQKVESFLEENKNQNYFIFGFTFLLYTTFFQNNKPLHSFDFSGATVIHGGGWKKLLNFGVTNQDLKRFFLNSYSIKEIRNYYGLVEQLGSIFFECHHGYLHSSDFSEITVYGKGINKQVHMQPGLVGLTSLLPTSYPGHRVLTEDIGSIHHIDDCPCGILGSAFLIHGRHLKAQIRGCSDASN
jgi:hypothetical protein